MQQQSQLEKLFTKFVIVHRSSNLFTDSPRKTSVFFTVAEHRCASSENAGVGGELPSLRHHEVQRRMKFPQLNVQILNEDGLVLEPL